MHITRNKQTIEVVTVSQERRRRALMGLPVINHKRFYRVMKANSLLLPKAPKRPLSNCVQNGVVAVDEPNQRWCSDGF